VLFFTGAPALEVKPWPVLLAILLCGATTGAARANPRPLPFTYTSETIEQGGLEIEQFADVVPLKALSSTTGGRVTYAATQFQTEMEYGITSRLELGLYLTLAPGPGEAFTTTARLTDGNGLKQRLRYLLAPPGEWPIDVGLYGEIAESDIEVELEGKIILQRRFGRLRIATNLWAEYELYYQPHKDIVLNPTLGATYEITPMVHAGAESWLRVEWPNPPPHPRPFDLGPHVYAGPTVLLNFGKLWWSTGLYLRTTDTGHSMQPAEAFGPFWARTIVGLEL
jgi:hypothetical protein